MRAVLVAVACLAAGCVPAPSPKAFDPDSIPDAYRRSVGALAFPGAPRAFLVTSEGDLYNGEWWVRFDASAGTADAGSPRVIAAEDRWLPVLHWTRRAGSVRLDFEAVAMGDPRNLVVSLEVRVQNAGETPQPVRIVARLERPDSVPPYVAYDAARDGPPLAWADGSSQPANAWAGGSAPSGAEHETSWTLGAGERREVHYLLTAYPISGSELASWAATPHRTRAAEMRRHWTRLLDEATRIDLGDPEVEHAIAGARVVLLACSELRGGEWLPLGGPLHYRDTWLRDAARSIQGLALWGHTREARDQARGMLAYQWPHGAFLSQRGQLDGTGQALWIMDQAVMRPAPDDSVGRFAAAALEAWRWLERQRAMGRELGTPFGSMMPFGDPNDNELVRAQIVGNDAWAIAGYRATARLLRASGQTAAAEEVERSMALYRDEFERALERTGHPDVPPSWQIAGHDWGNLTAGYPCQVLPPGHPRLAAMADRVWAYSGGAGLVTYFAQDSIHYYLGAELATWALLAGRVAQADSVLGAMLHWRSASGGAGELFTRGGDYGKNFPPHATSAGALLTLLRNSLVFDDGDTLKLTLGARAAWWRGARVERAPTRFGLLDLEFRRAGDVAEWRWTPVRAWTTLTLPPGARLAGMPPPPLLPGAADREVLAPPGTRNARVTLAAAGN